MCALFVARIRIVSWGKDGSSQRIGVNSPLIPLYEYLVTIVSSWRFLKNELEYMCRPNDHVGYLANKETLLLSY